MITIKKYKNRRLYDTSTSSYVTQRTIAQKIKEGADIRIVDAKTGSDITHDVLSQIVFESQDAASMLPTQLLLQLIRLDDAAFQEFFSQHLNWSLNVYLQMRQNPDAKNAGFPMNNPFTQMMSGFYNTWPGGTPQPQQQVAPEPKPQPPTAQEDDNMANLRAQVEELKNLVLLQAQQNK